MVVAQNVCIAFHLITIKNEAREVSYKDRLEIQIFVSGLVEQIVENFNYL
jgi:hypothetical protein